MSMFSDSLSPIPSTSTSPFRPLSANAEAGPSRLRRRVSVEARADTGLGTSTVDYEESITAVREVVATSETSVSRQMKSLPKRSRYRADTPITTAGDSTITTDTHQDPRGVQADESGDKMLSEMTRQASRLTASETGDGADSALFSEQAPQAVMSTQSGTTVAGGNMDDYIPQPEDQTMVPHTEETEFLGDSVRDVEAEDGGEEVDGLAQEPNEGEMEESHDRNDDAGDEEDGAETPAWLTEPFALVHEEEDQMTRVIAAKERKKAEQQVAASLQRKEARANGHGAQEMDELRDGPDVEDETMPASYHSGDTDDYEMDHRPVLDRTAIKRDIKTFVQGLECLKDPETGELAYRVVDRLGEGTFSSVYLAHDVFFHFYNNYSWCGFVDGLSRRKIASARRDIPVALKKILVTSSPARIENELHILESLRGCRNVSKLITAFREDDQVIIVMPYEMSDDFRHFYKHMDPWSIRSYMQCLMRALKDIHRRGIVHRDVKPANFLYHYDQMRGVLCDFGLAERYHPPHKPTCQHAPATLETLHGKRTKTTDTIHVETAVYEARKRARLGEGRIGFLADDKRPPIKTNRAGTRGFRAPEVLLKCPDQTVSIDIWSAGVILLSILAHKFPVFNSNDDIEALLEIAAIFGRGAMERCAMLHNRTIITNIPTVDSAPETLAPVIHRLNPHIYTPHSPNATPQEAEEHITMVDQAIDLCGRLLRLDATKRITAANALRHPFLAPREGEEIELDDMDDDEVLDVTDGKCGHLHGMDGSKHRAVFGNELIDLQFGQGIPSSRTSLCPEHEHWEERMDINVLAVSTTFEAAIAELQAQRDGGELREKGMLVERDVNVDQPCERRWK